MLKTCCSATITDECVTTAIHVLERRGSAHQQREDHDEDPGLDRHDDRQEDRLRDRPGDGGSAQTLFHLVVHLVGDGEAKRFHRPDLRSSATCCPTSEDRNRPCATPETSSDHGQHRQRSRFRGDRGIGRSRRHHDADDAGKEALVGNHRLCCCDVCHVVCLAGRYSLEWIRADYAVPPSAVMVAASSSATPAYTPRNAAARRLACRSYRTATPSATSTTHQMTNTSTAPTNRASGDA